MRQRLSLVGTRLPHWVKFSSEKFNPVTLPIVFIPTKIDNYTNFAKAALYNTSK